MEPLNEDSLRWLVSRYAHLHAEHGDAIGTPDLILPNGDFFPDEFTLDPDGILRVAKRMISYAPVSEDVPVGLAFLEAGDKDPGGGGCGTGACGTGAGAQEGALGGSLLETEDGYGITLAVADTGNPMLMTTALARGVGAMVLAEAGEPVEREMIGALSELTASVIGLGVILTTGAYVYGKSCGGVRMRQATHLPVEEHATLLALFCRVHGHKPGAARSELGTTQKEAFDQALAWVDSNEEIVEALRHHPETLVDGLFPIASQKSLLGRLLGGRGGVFGKSTGANFPARPEQIVPAVKRVERTDAEKRRLAEARAMVDEALRTR